MVYGPNFSRPPPDLINDEEQYKVEQIRNHRYSGRNRTLQYLIHWKGYPDSDDTWELAADTHTPDLVRAYHKGTPLESIKAGQLPLQNPISLHPGYQPRTTWLGRKFLDASSHSTLPTLSSISAPPSPVHYPQVSHLSPWTTDPSHSHPRSRTPILLPRTPLHLSHITASTTPSSTSAKSFSLPCPTTPSMHQPNPLGAAPTHPRPAIPLVEWKTYSPPTLTSTPPLFEKSQPVWSRPSKTVKKSIASPYLRSRTRSRGSSQPLKGTPKPMNRLPTDTSAILCTLTSRSHWVKEAMPRPTGLPQPTTGTYKHTARSKGPWIHPTLSPSTLGPSIPLSPLNPSRPGSTNSWLAPLPFTLTSPKRPTDLMTGASLRISRATANWTTTCPVSTRSSSGLKPRLGQSGS